MRLSLIAAMASNRVIGKDGKLPWHLPPDLKRFKKLTSGHVCIMGRRTFETDSGLLPNRTTVILTSDRDYRFDGARVCHSLEAAIAPYRGSNEEVFICGGTRVYADAMPLADRIYLTVIHQPFEGDTYFPPIPQGRFAETAREDYTEPLPFSMITYERVAGQADQTRRATAGD
jgi:dihydrofolate reductase